MKIRRLRRFVYLLLPGVGRRRRIARVVASSDARALDVAPAILGDKVHADRGTLEEAVPSRVRPMEDAAMKTIKRQSDGTKLPKDLRTNLRALRRFYGTSDVGAVVELRREAGRVWRRYLKRRRVTEAAVLDVAFGWHGVDDDRVGRALRADGDIPAPVFRRVLALARRGRAIVDSELPEREAVLTTRSPRRNSPADAGARRFAAFKRSRESAWPKTS